MNAPEIANAQELAVYHLAQSATYERMAARERLKACQHLAKAQIAFTQALKSAEEHKRNIPRP